jgi:fructose-1-phosphate kinase PfkB-like protein
MTGWDVRLPDVGGPWTVGAGDAFLAGLAAALAEDDPFEACLGGGGGAATASTMVEGPGNVDATVAEQATRRTKARRIA